MANKSKKVQCETDKPPRRGTQLSIRGPLKAAALKFVEDCKARGDMSVRNLSDLVNQVLEKKLNRS